MKLRTRRGFFLVMVLIVIAVATMAVYSFSELMLAYDESAHVSADIVQARVNVESGAEMVRLILSQTPESRVDFGGVFNNPQIFQAIVCSTGLDGVRPSNFSVIAPALDENGQYGGIRFGLQNESARLNINTLTVLEKNSDVLAPLALAVEDDSEVDTTNIAVSLLLALPGMTEETAEAIMDWLDEDSEPREIGGAEADYYSSLPTPYEPANGPLQSVDELLLVKGVTPTLLFGADSNRNGVLDPDEQTQFNVSSETPGAMGWSSYLTVHGAEANKTNSGELRLNVNQDDIEALYDQLVDALGNDLYASYIAAYRVSGSSNAVASALGGASGQAANAQNSNAQSGGPWTADRLEDVDLTGGGGTSLNQMLDLIDSTVTVGQGNEARSYSSPFPNDPVAMSVYLPILMDALTTQDADMMPGRINLNECPAELLYGIPLLSEEAVQSILENRSTESDDPNRQFETWPLVEGYVTVDEMRLLLPLLTGGGDVYRAQIIGYFEDVGVSHRSEVIVDATTVNPKIVSWRDLSHLGRGFDLAVLGMRSGLEAAAAP